MFNFGDSLNTCVRFGNRIVRYVYLGTTKIYTCAQCEPTAAKDPRFEDVLFVSDFNTSMANCALSRAPLELASWVGPNPVLSSNEYYTTPEVDYGDAPQSSLYFGSNGFGWVNFPPEYAINAANFTLEAWAYRNSANNYFVGNNNQVLFGTVVNAGSETSYLGSSSSQVVVAVRDGVWSVNGTLTSAVAPLNTWQHIAVVGKARRDLTYLGDYTLYVDGVAVGSTSYQALIHRATASAGPVDGAVYNRRLTVGFGIGPDSGGAFQNVFPGYIDDLRLTNHVRYTGAFNPPVSPLPNDIAPASSSSSSSAPSDPYFQNVAALLHFDADAVDPKTLRDHSRHNRYVPTTAGDGVANQPGVTLKLNTQPSMQSPAGGTGVLQLVGATDYTGGERYPVIVTGSGLSAGTGDYTLEFYWYPPAGPHYSDFGLCGPASQAGVGWEGLRILDYPGQGPRQFWLYSAQFLSNGLRRFWTVSLTDFANRWTHIAISRTNGMTRVFLDGQLATLGVDSTVSAADPFAQTATIAEDPINLSFGSGHPYAVNGQAMGLFGSYNHSQMMGYVDELRYTVGVGRYTTGFTAPTVQYPNS